MATDPGQSPPLSPFLQVLAPLQHAMTLDSPASFHGRILALKYVTAVAGFGALIHLSLLALDYHRRGWRSFWLFSLVPRPGGRYICTNSKVVSGLMSVLCLVLNVCYLSDETLAVLHGGSQQLTQAWRVFCPPAIIMHLYYLSWGQLQAYLVGLRDAEAELVSARLANGVFLGLGGGLFVAMMVVASLSSYLGAQFWFTFPPLQSRLLELNATWFPGKPYEMDLYTLQPQLAEFKHTGHLNNSGAIAAYGVFTFAVFCCVLVNLGSIVLAAAVRRRRRDLLHDESPMLVAPDLALNPVSTMSSSGQERQGAELKRTTTEGKISGADMRLLASQKHTVLGAKAQQQLVYRKAERDLLLMAVWCALISSGGLALGLWVTIPLLGLGRWSASTNWTIHETALTILQWLYAVLLVGLSPSLIHTAWRNLSPRSHPCRRTNANKSLPLPFLRNSNSSVRFTPRAGAAPSGRVRVIVEEQVREEYRHDLPAERLETIIEGGVFLDPQIRQDDPSGELRGGEGLGIEWIKPSWAADGESLTVPERAARSREARVSFLRWEVSQGGVPVESTAVHQVTPWAWLDRKGS